MEKRPGLFPYLLLRVLPVAAVLMAGISYFGLGVTQKIALNKANDLLGTQSQLTLDLLRLRLDSILSQTKNLSSNALLVNGLIDIEGRNDYLPKFFQTLRLAGYNNARIEMTDYKGRLIFDNQIKYAHGEEIDRWLEDKIENGKGGAYLSWKGLVSIEPILYAGNPEGALIVSLGQTGLIDLFDTGTQYNNTRVVDANQNIIYSSSSEIGKAGDALNPSDTAEWLMVESGLQEFPNIKIQTLQKRETALASQQWIENILIAGVISFLLILGIAIALTAYLTKRDVTGLAHVVKNIKGTKDMSHRIEPAGPAELYSLGVAFNGMMETLQNTTTSFEYVDSIISNTNDGIITVDSTGKIETINRAATEIFGYSWEEAVGNDISQIMSVTSSDIKNNGSSKSIFFSTYEAGGISELNATRKNGYQIPLELNVAPMQIGNAEKFIGIFRDISERKRVEKELLESKAKAEAANMAKSNFLATMSHEIRTPLNGVLGLAQLLVDTKLDDDQRKKVHTILSSGQILLAIINDVLDMSRIEAGGMQLEEKPFALQEIVSTFTTPFQSLADDKGLELRVFDELPSGTIVRGDPVRLRQILWNLLSNAIKFTNQGFIQLTLKFVDSDSIHITTPKHYAIHFAIEDSGVGIAPERIDAIFDAFTQEDSSITRKHGGTGLGLSIVRQITELMGGTIDVDSIVDKGTTFHVYLPFDEATQNEAEFISMRIADNPSHIQERLNVLIAEDNEVNAVIAQSFLEKFGHNVRRAGNGVQAVEQAAKGWADLILMDVHMPEMNGLDATKLIRLTKTGKTLPIIALTAEAFQERHAQFREAGMDAVMTKPFTEEQLREILAAHSRTDRREQPRPKGTPDATSDKKDETAAPVSAKDDGAVAIGNPDNLKELENQVGSETIRMLLVEAQKSLESQTEILTRAVRDEDVTQIRETAHAVKGSSSSLFGVRVSEIAKQLQENSSDLDAVQGLMPDFEKAARDTIKWWQEQAASLSTTNE